MVGFGLDLVVSNQTINLRLTLAGTVTRGAAPTYFGVGQIEELTGGLYTQLLPSRYDANCTARSARPMLTSTERDPQRV